MGQRDSHIKNSKQFVQLVQETEINDRDRLVSFEVCNLFTMVHVPVDEVIPIMRKKLEEDENLEEGSTLYPHRNIHLPANGIMP